MQGSYYKLGQEDPYAVSWGFCGEDCYLHSYQPDSGVIRMKANIHILSESACDTFLNYSMSHQTQVMELLGWVSRRSAEGNLENVGNFFGKVNLT